MSHFQGAYLRGVNFKCVDLAMADFKDADLSGAHFAGSNLDMAEFKNSKFFDEAIFDEDNYVSSENFLPPTPEDSKHKFEFILNDGEKKSEPKLDKNGKPTGATKYFIHLVPKTQNS